MLDERTNCLLSIINEKCDKGSYKILSVDQLIEALPIKYDADADLVRQMITGLSSGGFISLKFDRDEEFCLCPTPKGREYFENSKQTNGIKCSRISRFFPHFYNFVSIFCGTFLAILILRLIGVLC